MARLSHSPSRKLNLLTGAYNVFWILCELAETWWQDHDGTRFAIVAALNLAAYAAIGALVWCAAFYGAQYCAGAF